MYTYLTVFLVLELHGKIFAQNIGIIENAIDIKSNINDKLTYMDVLMEDLLNQHWDKEESTCLNKFVDIIINVKNSTLWAVWMWDSMQTPAGLLYGSHYSLGNYDQCMNPPWLKTHLEFRTQYCIAEIKLSGTVPNNTIESPYRSLNYHVNSVTKYGLKFNRINWGVCIPAECNTKSTSKFVRSLLKFTHLGHEIHKIDVGYCQVAGTTTEFSWRTDFFLYFFVICFFVTITCTMINRVKPASHNTCGNKLLKAFCLATNTFYLNKLSKDDIKVLHGLRVLACFSIVILHVLLISHVIGFNNSLTLEKDLDRLNIKAALRTDYAVDIFLLMSGLLRIKSFMAVGKIDPFKAVLKRYLRYIVLMSICVICSINIHNYIGDGPIWTLFVNGESKACQKNWLISLLMLGNYIDTENICYPVLWTVPVDFHLSVIATILYWIFQKNQKNGFITYAILMMTSLIIPGILTYYQNLQIVSAFDFVLAEQYKKQFLNKSYMMTHFRSGSYFIGIALGYFMSIYQPDRHRNRFSKLKSLIGIFLATATAVSIILLGVSLQNKTDTGTLITILYTSLHRCIWALAISCIIIVCEYGTVPLLGTVLTWSFFIPLSKISYCVYLVHTIIFVIIATTTRFPLQYNTTLLVFLSIGLIGASCIASMLLYLFVEAPTSRIIDIIIDTKPDARQKNEGETATEIKNGVLKLNDLKKKI